MRGKRRRGGAIGNPTTQTRRHDRLTREMFIREAAEGEEKDKDIRRGEAEQKDKDGPPEFIPGGI